MVPERSMKIPELGSAASARHSVMELPNRTFGNESSCQSLFFRLHDESMLFFRGLVSSVRRRRAGGRGEGREREMESGGRSEKRERGGGRVEKGGGAGRGNGRGRDGKRTGEVGKGRAERGKGEEKVGTPISTDVLHVLLQLLLVPCKGQNKLQLRPFNDLYIRILHLSLFRSSTSEFGKYQTSQLEGWVFCHAITE